MSGTEPFVRWQEKVGWEEKVGRAQAGSADDLAEICSTFEPLVRATAAKYRDVSLEDALQEGWLALIRAVHRYDGSLGVPFPAWAAARVRGDVRTAMRRWWRYEERIVRHRAQGETGGDEDALDWAARQSVGRRGMERPCQSGPSLQLRIPPAPAADAYQDPGYRAAEMRLLLDAAGLSPRERLCVEGLLKGYSCQELARAESVSVESVKTWRKRALRKLERCGAD
ncbi:MAG: sigma-70 family RNA polymerase sigma factor [Alicyclobacillus sp.]|nr:sigma-70 family RNA polymerase sigma factor [Alicyclobacillus sp.]